VVFSSSVEANIQSRYDSQNINTGEWEVVSAYSFAFKKTGTGNKFARLKNVQAVISKIRSAVKRDLSSKKKTTRETAFAVALLDETHRRVGGGAGRSGTPADGTHGKPKKFDKKAIAEKKKKLGKDFDAKKDGQIYERIRIKTYGITTLEARHVTQRKDGSVHLGFWGKDAVWNHAEITDASLAKELLRRKAEAKSGTSQIVGSNDTSVNNYLKAVSGIEMIAKDYRNFHATRIAEETATKMGDAPTVTEVSFKKALVKAFEDLAGDKISVERKEEVARAVMLTLQEQRLIDTVGEVVAPQLGHKPTESITTYVDPSVWEKVGWKKQFAKETERWVAKARTYSKQTLFPPKKKKKS
jgi:DNA topoisomerase IB